MTGFPIIIVYRVRVIGFTIAVIKLKNVLKRIISVYMASK